MEKVDSGHLDLAHSFQLAIYENLLEELNKTKKFKAVMREGDRKASEVPSLLILKTTVVKYTPGSETRRAVTTVSGATKLTVRTQLLTRAGEIVVDRTIWLAISPKRSRAQTWLRSEHRTAMLSRQL